MKQWWSVFIVIVSIVLVLNSGARTPAPTPSPTPIPVPTPIQAAPPAEIPIIEPTAKLTNMQIDKVIQIMDQGGIARIILSTRGKLTLEELISFAAKHPTRIIRALRTKGYMQLEDVHVHQLLKKQVNMYQFGGMAGVLIYMRKRRISISFLR